MLYANEAWSWLSNGWWDSSSTPCSLPYSKQALETDHMPGTMCILCVEQTWMLLKVSIWRHLSLQICFASGPCPSCKKSVFSKHLQYFFWYIYICAVQLEWRVHRVFLRRGVLHGIVVLMLLSTIYALVGVCLIQLLGSTWQDRKSWQAHGNSMTSAPSQDNGKREEPSDTERLESWDQWTDMNRHEQKWTKMNRNEQKWTDILNDFEWFQIVTW